MNTNGLSSEQYIMVDWFAQSCFKTTKNNTFAHVGDVTFCLRIEYWNNGLLLHLHHGSRKNHTKIKLLFAVEVAHLFLKIYKLFPRNYYILAQV